MPTGRAQAVTSADDVDLALADAFLEIQIAEHESGHFVHGNPSLWTGEAIFGVIALVTRPFAPLDVRARRGDRALARHSRLPRTARARRCRRLPAPWRAAPARVRRRGAALPRQSPALVAPRVARRRGRSTQPSKRPLRGRAAFEALQSLVAARAADGAADRNAAWRRSACACCSGAGIGATSVATLLHEARETLAALERGELARQAHRAMAAGPRSRSGSRTRIRTRDEYLPRFARIWEACRDAPSRIELVTWPDAPIRYVPIPEHTRDAAPYLYYLFYRSPAPFDRLPVHDYVVTPIDDGSAGRRAAPAPARGQRQRHQAESCRASRRARPSCAELPTRIAARRASDRSPPSTARAASACSAAARWPKDGRATPRDLMEEAGFLTPLESVAQQHTRVRLAGARGGRPRACTADAARLTTPRRSIASALGMSPDAAHGEAVQELDVPGHGDDVLAWHAGLHDCARVASARRAAFSLGRFHDRRAGVRRDPGAAHRAADDVRPLADARTGALAQRRAAPRRAARRRRTTCSIVGYDREPDTLNRFSTHILEDIQTVRRRGTHHHRRADERHSAARAEVPTLDNGGVTLRPDGGMDVTWRLRPGITWHDGMPFTSADVKFTVDAINDPTYNPESTDGFDRISIGRHAGSADRGRPLPRGLRALRTAVHPRHAAEARARRAATSIARRTTTAIRSAPGRTASPNGRPANTSCSSACPLLARRRYPKIRAAHVPVPRQHQHAHQPAEERRGARRRARAVGQVPRDCGHAGRS